YQNLLRPVPPVSRLQTDLLVWVALSQTPKADRRNSLMGSGQSIDLSPARPNWQTARHMQFAFSQRVQFAALLVANAIAISVASAQGPAPSPLLSAPSPPPANVPVIAPQPGSAPELTKADFETFLDALIPS